MFFALISTWRPSLTFHLVGFNIKSFYCGRGECTNRDACVPVTKKKKNAWSPSHLGPPQAPSNKNSFVNREKPGSAGLLVLSN